MKALLLIVRYKKTGYNIDVLRQTACLVVNPINVCSRVVLGRAYRGLTGEFFLLRSFSVAMSVSPYFCLNLVLIFDFHISKIMHL